MMKYKKHLWIGAAILLLTALGLAVGSLFPREVQAPEMPSNSGSEGLIPINDLGAGTYLGFEGGLYPGGSNEMPDAHRQEGLSRAIAIQPLDLDGLPNPNGKIILLSIGISNATQEFCNRGREEIFQCNPWTLTGRAEQSEQVNQETLRLVNGAASGQVTEEWLSPESTNYTRILNQHLEPQGLSEQQVQVIWLKTANSDPATSLPSPDADAFQLVTQMGEVLRTLKIRYPNLQMVFLSSRIYGGYGTSLNPEPFAYESGFAVKWLIEAQIRQMQTGEIDPRAGNLDYNSAASWIAWGPYLWANGATPRSDGLKWTPEDFRSDGIHPSRSGESIVGELLFEFFTTSPFSTPWFLAP